MQPNTVRVLSCAPPTIVWTCRCGHRRFQCSEKFRINTNGKLVDIWLIYRCERCQATKNVTVVERTSVVRIDRGLFDAATINDAATARSVARDVALLKRAGARVAAGDRWELTPTADGAAAARWATSAGGLRVEFDEPMLVRLDAVLAAALGISRTDLRKAAGAGALEIQPAGRIDRLRVWTGPITVRGRARDLEPESTLLFREPADGR